MYDELEEDDDFGSFTLQKQWGSGLPEDREEEWNDKDEE